MLSSSTMTIDRPKARVLSAPGGARAEVDGPPGEEKLLIRSAEGRLLFEVRRDGRAVLHAPDGDLEICAERGSVILSARDGVRIDGGPEISLIGSHLVARADTAEIDAGEVHVRSKLIQSATDYLHHTVGVAELRAERWVERFKDAYREVEGLSQTHAGRIRSVARETVQLLGRRTVLKAEEDMKIKGGKIHLG